MSNLKNAMANEMNDKTVLEPDLIIVIGKVFILSECPPWHTRISTIMYLGEFNHITKDDFDHIIIKYWQSKQRFGT